MGRVSTIDSGFTVSNPKVPIPLVTGTYKIQFQAVGVHFWTGMSAGGHKRPKIGPKTAICSIYRLAMSVRSYMKTARESFS